MTTATPVLPTSRAIPEWFEHSDVQACRYVADGRPCRLSSLSGQRDRFAFDLTHFPTRALLVRELAARRMWDGWWSLVRPEIAPDDVQARILYAALAALSPDAPPSAVLPRMVVRPWQFTGAGWYRYIAEFRSRPFHIGNPVAIVSENRESFTWKPGWRMHLANVGDEHAEGPEVGAEGRRLADARLPALGALTAESLGWAPP